MNLFKIYNETRRIYNALANGTMLCLKFDSDNVIIFDKKGAIRTIYYGDLLYVDISNEYIIFKCKVLYNSFCIDALYRKELENILKKRN